SGTVIMVSHRVIARRGIIGLAVRADNRIAISGAGLLAFRSRKRADRQDPYQKQQTKKTGQKPGKAMAAHRFCIQAVILTFIKFVWKTERTALSAVLCGFFVLVIRGLIAVRQILLIIFPVTVILELVLVHSRLLFRAHDLEVITQPASSHK